MKKIISLLLAMIMVFSLATVAFADTIGDPSTDNTNYVSDEKKQELTLTKIYNVVGNTDTALYPNETLAFTVTPGENNADMGTEEDPAPVVTVDELPITSNGTHTIYVNLPVYDTVGIYEYTITEDAGESQGAVYSEAEIAIKVLVTYNYAEKKLDSEVVLATATTNGKLDTFVNTYNVGTLTVNKTVTGNLADSNAYFNMTVTFTAEDVVNSDITISGGSDSDNPTKIDKGWTGTKTINFKLRSGETLTFADVPNGVTYVVEESAEHLKAEGATVNPNSDGDKEYTVTYTNEEGTIVTNTTSAVQIDNEKSTSVETGIALDSAPYFVILAVAMFGMVALVSKKRYEV